MINFPITSKSQNPKT
uniref:Uncharacterized protein n=1 Tax=Lepeophtheirus salmonis TaxID=72036 RepID=A0A0K2VGJ3_LEPSM